MILSLFYPCADPESFVRGGSTETFFLVAFCVVDERKKH